MTQAPKFAATQRYLQRAITVPMLLLLALAPGGSLAGEFSEVRATRPPELRLPDLSAQARSLDEFAGKVILVNFWASWCIPCIEELPGIKRLAAAMHDLPFTVIGVNVGETPGRARTTAKRLKMDFTVLLDRDSAVFNRWGGRVLPTAYVLDRNGRIRYIGRGSLEWDRSDILASLRELALARPEVNLE